MAKHDDHDDKHSHHDHFHPSRLVPSSLLPPGGAPYVEISFLAIVTSTAVTKQNPSAVVIPTASGATLQVRGWVFPFAGNTATAPVLVVQVLDLFGNQTTTLTSTGPTSTNGTWSATIASSALTHQQDYIVVATYSYNSGAGANTLTASASLPFTTQ
jgi:hypothetical protein